MEYQFAQSLRANHNFLLYTFVEIEIGVWENGDYLLSNVLFALKLFKNLFVLGHPNFQDIIINYLVNVRNHSERPALLPISTPIIYYCCPLNIIQATGCLYCVSVFNIFKGGGAYY